MGLRFTHTFWKTVTEAIPRFITVARQVIDRIVRSEWITTFRQVAKTFWEKVTEKVPLLGWLGKVIGFIWKTIVKPVIRWVTEAIRALRTWVENIIRWVTQKIQDGWNYITRQISETIREWVEKTDWAREWMTKEITVWETVWEQKFVAFPVPSGSGGLLAALTPQTWSSLLRYLGAGTALATLAATASMCATASSDPCPTPTPLPPFMLTQTAVAWQMETLVAEMVQGTSTALALPSTVQPLLPTPTPIPVLSQQGLEMMAHFETFVPHLYDDPYNCTIGYGYLVHLGPCNGDPLEAPFVNGISPEEGLKLLNQKVSEAEKAVKELVKVPLNQCQFDALVSFTYNVGKGDKQLETGLAGSDLLEQLNLGNYEAVPGEMARFVKAYDEQGQLVEMPGLTNRRQVEGTLFANCKYP